MRVTWGYIALVYTVRAFWFVLPKRYPVPGKTRVRVSSYTHREEWTPAIPTHVYKGTVVGPEYDFVGPFEQRRGYSREGMYIHGHEKWSDQWVIQLDDEDGTLEQQELSSFEYVSNYRWGVPVLTALFSLFAKAGLWRYYRRVGDLPYPIGYYRGDFVTYEGDEAKMPRMVLTPWFGMDGQLTYSLAETLSERKQRHAAEKQEAEQSGDSWGTSSGPEKRYLSVSGEALSLVRRGNYYHLAHGNPEDLSFPHITLEVEFWKGVGTWLADGNPYGRHKKRFPEMTHEEAKQKLLSGEIDTVSTGRDDEYSQIALPDRFVSFRERAREASLVYLEKYPGKYSFDVVSKSVLEEYNQTCC